MSRISFKSPAKINLYLKILKRLNGGYHNINTSFQLIDLFDELEFKKVKKVISIRCENFILEKKKNLVYKIAKKLHSRNTCNGIEINIKKNIPIGAGLGGGSSNAATAIIILNRLWDLKLSKTDMLKLGKSFGADIPFFINGENAIGTGIGDRLSVIESKKQKYVLICPNIFCSTKKMFEKYDLLDDKYKKNTQNSFWDVLLNQDNILKNFYNKNIDNFNINLSGSGSSMFIKYENEDELNKILKIIPNNWRFFLCKPLQYSPLREFI